MLFKEYGLFSVSARSGSRALLVLGACFHLACLASIFSIYFTSPIIHGMRSFATPLPSPAKRLVLFVGDGLRADKAFSKDENGEPYAKFLIDVAREKGRWGVSRTRVPTESRPGHVALIAGFYEDVSAVTKGWKENPVEFDHVFNQSSQTWGWGSPDIVTMFSHGPGLDDGHVVATTYPPDVEDFGSSDASKLDTWVFDKVKAFVQQAKEDQSLAKKLNQEKVVLFLHLLGIDTNGHAHKPFSKEYLENIRHVDKGIKEIVDLVEGYFNDQATAYVFTADHGMSNRGSHGSGHPDETDTPLICWGAGVGQPDAQYDPKNADSAFNLLPANNRKDVAQADIAPLMAALLGTSFPVNSVGRLPTEYLGGSAEFRARSLQTNALQILQQIQVAADYRVATQVLYKPYPGFAQGQDKVLVENINKAMQEGRYEDAIPLCHRLIDQSLEALRYFQTYDRHFLQSTIVCGYAGWLLLTLMFVVYHYTPICAHLRPNRAYAAKDTYFVQILFASILVFLYGLLFMENSPPGYYIYVTFPVLFWCVCLCHRPILAHTLSYVWQSGLVGEVSAATLVTVAGLECLVLVFFHRWVLSLMLAVGALWPWVSNFTSFTASARVTSHGNRTILAWLWAFLCLVDSQFPRLPVEKDTNTPLVLLGAGLIAFIGLVQTRMARASFSTRSVQVLLAQVALLCVSMGVALHSTQNLTDKAGLPLPNQLFAWATLVCPFLFPFLIPKTQPIPRMLSTALAWAVPFILLSVSYEAVFYACMVATLLVWVSLEDHASAPTQNGSDKHQPLAEGRMIQLDDIHVAFFYLFFLLYGFFGMGNIASVNSFDPASCYRFLTVFSPFTMGALMIGKVLMPLVIASCAFSIVAGQCRQVHPRGLFLVTVALSDVMALNFFFLVKDEGSWLDIGTSISHFVINSAVIIFLPIFNAVARFYIGPPTHQKMAVD